MGTTHQSTLVTRDATLDAFATTDDADSRGDDRGNDETTDDADSRGDDRGNDETTGDADSRGDDRGNDETTDDVDGGGDDRGGDEVNADAAAHGEIDPSLPTTDWTPAGATCAACGAVVERRWRQDDALVCPDCKDWSGQ